MAEFCMTVRSTQPWGMAIFEHKHFTGYGSDALNVWC